jgi:hypothetical protein
MLRRPGFLVLALPALTALSATACGKDIVEAGTGTGAGTAAGGLTMQPGAVRDRLYDRATDHACPKPRLFHYPDPDLPSEFDAYCEDRPRSTAPTGTASSTPCPQ